MLEAHKGQWRARLRFNVDGGHACVRGPCRDDAVAAKQDLKTLLQAKSGRRGVAAYEATASAAADLKLSALVSRFDEEQPDQRQDVLRLAREAVSAMESRNGKAAVEALGMLLSHRSGLDGGLLDGRTLLTEAVRHSCHDAAELLLEHGANPNVASDSGLAPLHVAAMSGKLSLMHSLLQWGADPSLPDAGGMSPLQKAVVLAPPATLQAAREMLLTVGVRETSADLGRLAARLRSDRDDAAYLARFRGDGAAPPSIGVASHGL